MKNRRFCKLLFIAILASFVVSSCLKEDETDEITYTAENEQALLEEYLDNLIEKNYDIDTTANGVYYIVLEEGDGPTAQAGDYVSVVYDGFFIGGTVFDSSGDPTVYGYFNYTHGVDNMIQGWNEGIETIKEGGKSLLIIPSDLAYGETGYYEIPPYTTLIFSIYVHDIVSPGEE